MWIPCEINIFASTLLIYWAGLEEVGDKELVVSGASRPDEVAGGQER